MAEETQRVRVRGVALLAGLARWVGLAFALILAIHVVLTVGNANPDNWITTVFDRLANPLALAFKDLFLNSPDDDVKLRVLINYGLAAIFWLVVSSIIARLIRRLA